MTRARTLGEEHVSAAIQGSAALAGGVGLACLLVQAWPGHDPVEIAALTVYGLSLVTSFLASALYHGIQHSTLKPVLQRLDHCAIFLLIAGTYTPVALIPLRQHGGLALLICIWTLAATGIFLRLWHVRLYGRIAVPLYLAMGWLCLGWGLPLTQAIGLQACLLMVAGGLCYSGGLIFYGWHRLPFNNPVWHACVVAGSVWFFVAIARFS